MRKMYMYTAIDDAYKSEFESSVDNVLFFTNYREAKSYARFEYKQNLPYGEPDYGEWFEMEKRITATVCYTNFVVRPCEAILTQIAETDAFSKLVCESGEAIITDAQALSIVQDLYDGLSWEETAEEYACFIGEKEDVARAILKSFHELDVPEADIPETLRWVLKKRYEKAEYVISAEKVGSGVEVYNYLEDCRYVTTDEKCIVLTGTVNEQWVVTEDKLRKTYLMEDGSEIASVPEGAFSIMPKPSGETVFAERVTEQISVMTSWGEELKANRDGVPHGDGDYIVYSVKDDKPDPEDRWVVNGEIFPRTYQEV